MIENNYNNKKGNNSPPTIICLYAPADCGKTKTIRSLFLKLGGDKRALAQTHDFVDHVNFGNKNIGFASQGDPGSPQRENLERLYKRGCEIMVTASRTKGDTVDEVCDFANNYGYTVVWISPFYFNDAEYGIEPLFDYFAERNADSIAKYIIDVLI